MSSPEAAARQNIDRQLELAGWTVQDKRASNLYVSSRVAVREVRSRGGPADYILFVEGKALGVVEAKKEGTTSLSAVADQSERYSMAQQWFPQRWADPLPFTYETTGVETNFHDQRPVFAFHRPEYLLELIQQPDTLRATTEDTLRTSILAFDAEINTLDQTIAEQETALNAITYNLYHLTPGEISIVEADIWSK